jgi:hypothetical protein
MVRSNIFLGIAILSLVFFCAHLFLWNQISEEFTRQYSLSFSIRSLLAVLAFLSAFAFGIVSLRLQAFNSLVSTSKLVDIVLLVSVSQSIGTFAFYLFDGSDEIGFLAIVNAAIGVALFLSKKVLGSNGTVAEP